MNADIISAIASLLDERLGNGSSEYLDSAATCQFLGISKATLYKYNYRRLIPYSKPKGSKKVYYRRGDLIYFLSQNHVLSREEIDQKTCNLLSKK